MGGKPKALIELAGTTLLDRAIAAIVGEVSDLAVNLPPGLDVPGLRVPTLRDETPTYEGPLAGVLAGLRWAAAPSSRPSHLLTVPVDLPFLPPDLVPRLTDQIDHPDTLVFAWGSEGGAPLCALWPLSVTERLVAFLAEGSNRRVKSFISGERTESVVFETVEIEGRAIDPFFNINTPDDLTEAAEMAALVRPWSSRRAESGSTQ